MTFKHYFHAIINTFCYNKYFWKCFLSSKFKHISVIVHFPSKWTLKRFKIQNYRAQWKNCLLRAGNSWKQRQQWRVRTLNPLKHWSIMTMCSTVQEGLCFKLAVSVLQSHHAHMSMWTLLVLCAIKSASALIVRDLPLHLPKRSAAVESYLHNMNRKTWEAK